MVFYKSQKGSLPWWSLKLLSQSSLNYLKQAITRSRAANSKRMVNKRPLLFFHHRKGKEQLFLVLWLRMVDGTVWYLYWKLCPKCPKTWYTIADLDLASVCQGQHKRVLWLVQSDTLPEQSFWDTVRLRFEFGSCQLLSLKSSDSCDPSGYKVDWESSVRSSKQSNSLGKWSL